VSDKNVIIIGASSDIGTALSQGWQERGWNVYGTYRTKPREGLVHCDLADGASVQSVWVDFYYTRWDTLVMCPGALEPIAPFSECRFAEWQESVTVNFMNQMRIVHLLLPNRRKDATVLFFAGSGTNSAPLNYSAYTVSKIALIKMTELLAVEIPDTKFVVLGPGWVKTKIHRETPPEDVVWTPMERVVDFCDWAIEAPREIVSGRNFSIQDKWGSQSLEEELAMDNDMYKLRRCRNDY